MSWRREQQRPAVQDSGTRGGEYESALFAQFVQGIDRFEPGTEVLDLGPTTPDNLLYWLGRGHPVTALDLAKRDPSEPNQLQLGERRFAGILCWNTLGALTRDAAGLCVAELRRHLLPGGLLFAIFDGDGRKEPSPVRYRIVADGRLSFEPAEPSGRLRAVPTREIEALMTGLKPTRVTVMRHGSREAIGQAAAAETTAC